jgi:hypothetical protein
MKDYQKAATNGETFSLPVDGVGVVVETITASTTLTYNDSDKIILIGTDELVVTLPATVAGLRYTVLNSGANGNNIITISPNASDKIMGSFVEGGVNITMSGTDNKDIVNTKSTAKKGDYITLVGDGVDGWYIEKAKGIWTEESQIRTGIVDTVSTIAEATTLTAADSGKVLILSAATGAAVTLPALASGLKFKFIIAATFATTNWTVVTASSTNKIQGGAVVNSVFVPAADEDTISFVASAETVGDFIDLVSDGTNWYASGIGAGDGSITFTVAS